MRGHRHTTPHAKMLRLRSTTYSIGRKNGKSAMLAAASAFLFTGSEGILKAIAQKEMDEAKAKMITTGGSNVEEDSPLPSVGT